jgi:hypothetical protein
MAEIIYHKGLRTACSLSKIPQKSNLKTHATNTANAKKHFK